MRSYLRFDPEFPDRKAHYPDGAMATFAITLCYAEHQPQRGIFKRAVLKALLGRRARWIPYLLEHGDLEELPDGKLYMVGWNEWQEGDWKVQERVQRIRARRGVTADVTVLTVTKTTVPPVNTPSEHLAVGGRRLAKASAVTVDAVKDQDDPGLELAVLMEPLLGHALSAVDIQNCGAALLQFEYLTGLEHFVKRAEEHNTVCQVKSWPKPRTIEGYFDSWRRENEYMADKGALKPRTRAGVNVGLTKINLGDLVRVKDAK